MNNQIKDLAEQAGIMQPERFHTSDGGNQLERFAQLIIAECMAQPRVYLLNKLNATDSEANWELHGWTNDLTIAHQWRASSGRDTRRDFESLYFVKRIDAL